MHETVRLLSRQLIGLNYQADTGDSTALSYQGTAGPWDTGHGHGSMGRGQGTMVSSRVVPREQVLRSEWSPRGWHQQGTGTTVWVVPSRVAPKGGPFKGANFPRLVLTRKESKLDVQRLIRKLSLRRMQRPTRILQWSDVDDRQVRQLPRVKTSYPLHPPPLKAEVVLDQLN
jgi:hypothetical protein